MRGYLSMMRPRGGSGGGSFVYPMLRAVPGESLQSDKLRIVTAADLGMDGDGPEHWLQPSVIAVRSGQSVTLTALLRPGNAGAVPAGHLGEIDFSNVRPLQGALEGSLDNLPDYLADAVYVAAGGNTSSLVRFWHDEGAFYDLTVISAVAPTVFSVENGTLPGGSYTAFKPGSTLSLTVTAADTALMDEIYIDDVLVHTLGTPSHTATFDWAIPAVPLEGHDASYDFIVDARKDGFAGNSAILSVPLHIPALVAQTLRVEDYPGDQLALKGAEVVTMTGRLQTPNTGAYSFTVLAPAGFTLVSQSYTSGGVDLTNYTVSLQRTTATDGLHNVQFRITAVASGMTVDVGTHNVDVQLTAPTLEVQSCRLRFGAGSNAMVVHSTKRLKTPPVLANFTYASAAATGGRDWEYSYSRNAIAMPAAGEAYGQGTVNGITVSTGAVGGAGATQNTVDGVYTLFGWHGTKTYAFTDAYVKLLALGSGLNYGMVDPGTVVAASNGSDAPSWSLCYSDGTVVVAPTATHIKQNDGGDNASGLLTLSVTSE